MDPIQSIRARMTDEDVRLLSDIYAPTEVATPDADAWSNLTLLRDGRIRFYGHYGKKHIYDTAACDRSYLESCDGGLSWKRHLDDKRRLGPSVYVPFLDAYLAVRADETGTYAYLGQDPDDDAPLCFCASAEQYLDIRTPFIMQSRDRILVVAHETRHALHPTAYFPVLLISEDGRSWRTVPLEGVPFYRPEAPRGGVRWQQNNRENTMAELSDGRLMMLSRTATDYHYICYSEDGGESWSEPCPSVFHGTATMPQLTKLSDGRLLFLWCNTRPLPELAGADGVWEDVFTNRDANHAAISEDDGETWIGFREMALNPLRCAADFRSNGGPEDDRDKSVHQFEALELPFGKILVAYGQHKVCRRLIIFDINWLYDKNRCEDFLHGLDGVSTQAYVKSILGGFRGTRNNPTGVVGHCAYNRTHGAMLVPSPEKNGREVLHICYTDDARLVSNVGGVTWNFPAARRGVATVRMRIEGKPVRLSLLDHWVNPCDTTVKSFSHVSAIITRSMLQSPTPFTEVSLEFDCDRDHVALYVDRRFIAKTRLHGAAPVGLCYLHVQSAADKPDPHGALISEMRFEAAL